MAERLIVKFDKDLFPVADMGCLIRALQGGNSDPDYEKKVLEELLREGVLSREKQGNYEVVPVVYPDFVVNPVLKGDEKKVLYFTTKGYCEKYRDRFARAQGIREGEQTVFPVSKNGEFQVPDSINPLMWRVLRLKCRDYKLKSGSSKAENIALMLVLREVLINDNNGYGVFLQISSKKRKNLGINGYYFSNSEDARNYANSFPKEYGVKIKVSLEGTIST